jgi:hypothetical protein
MGHFLLNRSTYARGRTSQTSFNAIKMLEYQHRFSCAGSAIQVAADVSLLVDTRVSIDTVNQRARIVRLTEQLVDIASRRP